MATATATNKSWDEAHSSARILVVSDSEKATGIVEALDQKGHDVQRTAAFDAATFDQTLFDIVFVEGDQIDRATEVVGSSSTPMVAIGEVADVLSEVCVGVVPTDLDGPAMSLLVNLVIERSMLQQRCEELEMLLSEVGDGSPFVGRSPVMRRLNGTLRRAADGDVTVLIEGARGAGKSLAARMIHCKSRRGSNPIETQSATTITDASQLEQALEDARETTLLIDDIEHLSATAQQALVHFLKRRSQANADSGARIIATTSVKLPELVARGKFREDLYYRLHAFPVALPALRERLEDLPELVDLMLDHCATQSSYKPHGITTNAVSHLQTMSWPGNMTQLENVVRRAYLTAGGEPIDVQHLEVAASPTAETANPGSGTPGEVVDEGHGELTEDSIRPFEEEEQRLLSRALRATSGNVRRAAQLLGIGRATLYRKIQQYRLRLQ